MAGGGPPDAHWATDPKVMKMTSDVVGLDGRKQIHLKTLE